MRQDPLVATSIVGVGWPSAAAPACRGHASLQKYRRLALNERTNFPLPPGWLPEPLQVGLNTPGPSNPIISMTSSDCGWAILKHHLELT